MSRRCRAATTCIWQPLSQLLSPSSPRPERSMAQRALPSMELCSRRSLRTRQPPYEVWGQLIKALEVVLLGALAYLIYGARKPSSARAQT